MSQLIHVAIIETEKGINKKIDEIRTFSSKEKADRFIIEFNEKNDEKEVPDSYLYAKLMSSQS